jgi:hypothetical protein
MYIPNAEEINEKGKRFIEKYAKLGDKYILY